MQFGINRINLPRLSKNPLSTWFSWYIKTVRFLLKHRNKNLKIGYLSYLHNVEVGNYNTIYDNVDISNTKIDDFVYVSNNSKITNASIGKFCSIGPNVKIGLPMHPTNMISTFPAFFSTRKQCQISFTDKDYFTEVGRIRIGNDVWVGDGVTIINNVIIGDGAIIAAGAVITKDVEPYSIVGGVPGKIIKYRFSKADIDKLLNFKWWNKDINWLSQYYTNFRSIDFFLELLEKENVS